MEPTQPKQLIFRDEWITLRQAAELMHTNEKDLRRRDPLTGEYVVGPRLTRIRLGEGKTARFRFLLSEVLEWRRQIEQAARAQAAQKAPAEETFQTFDPIKDRLARLGMQTRQMRGLGIR